MQSIRSRQRGFTLVEMLVVLGIIAILVGLLLPAVMSAMGAARRSQMAMEISQLDQAINAYKNKFGDYPPSLRGQAGYDAFIRHVRRCYPKIDSNHLGKVVAAIWPNAPGEYDTVRLDEGEALTFWLSGIDNDPQQPFKSLFGHPMNSRVVLYEFDPQRLVTATTDGSDGIESSYEDEAGNPVSNADFPSYRTKYAGGTCYIYIDHRGYQYYATVSPAVAESGNLGTVRPYFANASAAVNPTGFQILCAGQDGEFGAVSNGSGPLVKLYPSGENYTIEDNDNITNFSNGRRLEDNLP